ncbi:hypothetical protein [Antarcticirhabdus aurantiaca]|uniref:hypothetical protein n=1 Tax=Antarcticirhabdus aurantiaca TaxID=2606717 RepID=UPI00131E898C|nr:hypothetical protein [Antarcticirhabdus aurantiaca]
MQHALTMPFGRSAAASIDDLDAQLDRELDVVFRRNEGLDLEEPAPVGVTDPLGFWGVLGLVLLALIVGALAGGLGAFVAAAPSSCEVL